MPKGRKDPKKGFQPEYAEYALDKYLYQGDSAALKNKSMWSYEALGDREMGFIAPEEREHDE